MAVDLAELERAMVGAKNQPLLTSATAARSVAVREQVRTDRWWRYSGPLDERNAPICRFLHGKIFDRETPEGRRWLPPVHIN